MFNYNQSLKEIRGEDVRLFDSKPAGRIAAMVDSLRERFKKKDEDMDYYKTSLIC